MTERTKMPRRLPPALDSVRWAEGTRGHVESFFLKANDPDDPRQAFWLKFTLLAPLDPEAPVLAEVWAIRFDGHNQNHRGSKASFPVDRARLSREGLGFEAPDCFLRPGRTCGSVGEGADRITWDLRFDYRSQRPWLALPSEWMYEGGFPKTKTYTSCPTTRFTGHLGCGDSAQDITSWLGMLGHNWGPAHNPAYHWAQCNLFSGSPTTVFEGVSARIPLGPFLSPWLTMATVRHEGEEIRFNRFTRVLNRSVHTQLFAWSFHSRQNGWKLDWEVKGEHADFAGLAYIDPQGGENHCLNSKIATCRLKLARKERGKWLDVADLVGPNSCAYEIITQDPSHGVPILA